MSIILNDIKSMILKDMKRLSWLVYVTFRETKLLKKHSIFLTLNTQYGHLDNE